MSHIPRRVAEGGLVTGRPTDYTPAVADTICERIAAGESLRGVCRDDDMPDASTVFRWLASNSETYSGFREQYARARDIQADALVDEILEISDDGTNDWMTRQGKDGESGWAVNGEHIQRSRLRVDSRKWFASKVAPKKYGDKLQQELTGADGGPVQHEVTHIERTIIDPNPQTPSS